MTPSQLTLSVFTENNPGLLHRVTSVFTRRGLNIENLTVSPSELPGLHRYTIQVQMDIEAARLLGLQLEKQVEVLKVLIHEAYDVVERDLAMYKMPAEAWADHAFRVLITEKQVTVLEQHPEYSVLEKTGSIQETTALFESLLPFGILEFVRSGSVALTRPMDTLNMFVKEIDQLRDVAAHMMNNKEA